MSDHDWCRDTARDESIRAAEDAAAVPSIQHRDLPEVVAALTERVARLEAAQATLGSGDVYADVGCGSTGDEIARLTAERDAAKEECERRLTMCESMKRERDAAQFNVSCLTARVAELERDRRPATWQEEEAAVEGAWLLCGLEPDWPSDEPGTIVRHAESMRREIVRLRARVAELEAAAAPAANAGGEQQPPRGWLTEEERKAVQDAADRLHNYDSTGPRHNARVLRALLARETPPRVKGPTGWAYDAHDTAWIAAIRAAGGEVAE